MSEEFDSLDVIEKAAVEAALSRCRVLARQIEIEIRWPTARAERVGSGEIHCLSQHHVPYSRLYCLSIRRRHWACTGGKSPRVVIPHEIDL